MDQKVQEVLNHYHQRIERENGLIKTMPSHEIEQNRDKFLLSVGEETAVFLNNLVKAAKPKIILEIGTSYGYSTIWLAEAAQMYGGKVISLEIDQEKADYAKQKINEAELTTHVNIVIGDALKFLEETNLTFDFVLVDLWKDLYIPCFDLFFPKLNQGAYVISDNMIFPPNSKEEMDIYRNHLKTTKSFDSVLLPIGSGIEVSQFLKQ
jgi:predicted O-methyltransferase YrrM